MSIHNLPPRGKKTSKRQQAKFALSHDLSDLSRERKIRKSKQVNPREICVIRNDGVSISVRVTINSSWAGHKRGIGILHWYHDQKIERETRKRKFLEAIEKVSV